MLLSNSADFRCFAQAGKRTPAVSTIIISPVTAPEIFHDDKVAGDNLDQRAAVKDLAALQHPAGHCRR
ncbi:MAG: hypothetical protein WDN06_07990 [Asticcacaulis sp.]